MAIDTLGHRLAPHVTSAQRGDRCEWNGSHVPCRPSRRLCLLDQGYTGKGAATAAAGHGIAIEAVRLPEPRRGFVFLPRGWVVERRSLGRSASAVSSRLRALCRTPARPHIVAFLSHDETGCGPRRRFMTAFEAFRSGSFPRRPIRADGHRRLRPDRTRSKRCRRRCRAN
nr:hypothetical protein [uncultured organism]